MKKVALIGGFDLMQTVSMMDENTKVSIESIKPPKGLNSSPYFNCRELPEDKEEFVFFVDVVSATNGLHKNVNVAQNSAQQLLGVHLRF